MNTERYCSDTEVGSWLSRVNISDFTAVKVPENESLQPYTRHHRRRGVHEALEVEFIGTNPQAHLISITGGPVIQGMPRYIFTKHQDFMEFKSEIRGKDLAGIFNVRQVDSASSSKIGDATDQQMTIWRHNLTRETSVSFYANNLAKPGFIKFPLAIFKQDVEQKNRVVVIQMGLSGAQFEASSLSKSFSLSPAGRTSPSSSTTSTFLILVSQRPLLTVTLLQKSSLQVMPRPLDLCRQQQQLALTHPCWVFNLRRKSCH